jgi:hypothetical protein
MARKLAIAVAILIASPHLGNAQERGGGWGLGCSWGSG